MNKSVHIAAMRISLYPISYEDAILRDDSTLWKQAMDEEMSSLLKNKTWDRKTLSDRHSVVSCR